MCSIIVMWPRHVVHDNSVRRRRRKYCPNVSPGNNGVNYARGYGKTKKKRERTKKNDGASTRVTSRFSTHILTPSPLDHYTRFNNVLLLLWFFFAYNAMPYNNIGLLGTVWRWVERTEGGGKRIEGVRSPTGSCLNVSRPRGTVPALTYEKLYYLITFQYA